MSKTVHSPLPPEGARPCIPYKDLSGKKFGRVLVLGHPYRVKNATMWWCLCECGTSRYFFGSNLTRGYTMSCGCWGVAQAIAGPLSRGHVS